MCSHANFLLCYNFAESCDFNTTSSFKCVCFQRFKLRFSVVKRRQESVADKMTETNCMKNTSLSALLWFPHSLLLFSLCLLPPPRFLPCFLVCLSERIFHIFPCVPCHVFTPCCFFLALLFLDPSCLCSPESR